MLSKIIERAICRAVLLNKILYFYRSYSFYGDVVFIIEKKKRFVDAQKI